SGCLNFLNRISLGDPFMLGAIPLCRKDGVFFYSGSFCWERSCFTKPLPKQSPLHCCAAPLLWFWLRFVYLPRFCPDPKFCWAAIIWRNPLPWRTALIITSTPTAKKQNGKYSFRSANMLPICACSQNCMQK